MLCSPFFILVFFSSPWRSCFPCSSVSAWCTKAVFYRNFLAPFFLFVFFCCNRKWSACKSVFSLQPCKVCYNPFLGLPKLHSSLSPSLGVLNDHSFLTLSALFPWDILQDPALGRSVNFLLDIPHRWSTSSWGPPLASPVNRVHFTSLSGQILKLLGWPWFSQVIGQLSFFFIVGDNQKRSPYSAKASTEGSAAWPALGWSLYTQPNHPALQGNPRCTGELNPHFVSWARNIGKILPFLAEKKATGEDAVEGICNEGAFQESQRSRATSESAGSLGSSCLRGTGTVWGAGRSEAGQRPCVPLLLQELLRGEVLKQKIKETEVFVWATFTRQ